MQSSPQQLDLLEYTPHDIGASLRDIGMVEAEFAETLTGSNFSEIAYAAICHVARRQCEVHVDDVLAYCKIQPLHSNAWGSVWLRAIKDGVIIRTGTVRPCLSDPVKRVHNYPVYRSGLFHGRTG